MSTTAVAQVLDQAAPALRPTSEPALRQISPAIVAQPAKISRRQSLRQLAFAAGLIAAVVGGGWYGEYWWTTGRFIESTDDAYVGGNVTPLAPHVDGFVADVLVTDNERVHAGQVLIRARSARLPDRARERAGGPEGTRGGSSRVCARNIRCSNPRSASRRPTSPPKRRRRRSPSQEAARAHVPGAAEFGSRQDRGTQHRARAGGAGGRDGRASCARGWQTSSSRCSTRRSREADAARGAGPGRSADGANSISATPRSARRSTAMSAIAPARSAPT